MIDTSFLNGDSGASIRDKLNTNSSVTKTVERLTFGMSEERQDFWYRVIDDKVFIDVWKLDEAGNIASNQMWTHNIGGVLRQLDCANGVGVYGKDGLGGTGAYRIELPQGTVGNPLTSYVYATYDEQQAKLVLAVSEHEPTGEVGLVCKMAIETHTETLAHQPIGLQRLSQTVDIDLQGAIAYILSKIRATTTYDWGVDFDLSFTPNAGAIDTVSLNTTAGQVKQRGTQFVRPMSIIEDGIHIFNVKEAGVIPTNNHIVYNIGDIRQNSEGTQIADGQYANVQIWGLVNHGGASHMCANLPDKFYTTADSAIHDVNGYANKQLPQFASGIGFMIGQIVMRYNSADGGTWSNALENSVVNVKVNHTDYTSPSYPYYDNNYHGTVNTIEQAGAIRMRAVFKEFETEANYDYCKVQTSGGSTRGDYHGSLGAFTSAWVEGSTMLIRFDSDGSVTRKGWIIDYVEYEVASQIGGAMIDQRGTLLNS